LLPSKSITEISFWKVLYILWLSGEIL